MKNQRTVFGIIAFATTFIVSVAVMGVIFPTQTSSLAPVATRHRKSCGNDLAKKLEAFIERDKSNGETREYAILRGKTVSPSAAESVKIYWESSSAMDAGDFPRDFRVAWNDHMKAWYEYSEFVNARKGKTVNPTAFESESERLDAEITRTWNIVLSSARKYGADVF
jgi:hypothetical protein